MRDEANFGLIYSSSYIHSVKWKLICNVLTYKNQTISQNPANVFIFFIFGITFVLAYQLYRSFQ